MLSLALQAALESAMGELDPQLSVERAIVKLVLLNPVHRDPVTSADEAELFLKMAAVALRAIEAQSAA